MTDNMTIQEAITELEGCYLVQSDDEGRRRNKAVTMAIEALEKQMPKKPLIAKGWIQCPKCGLPLRLCEKWCDNCGQALDWESDTDG